MIAAKCFWLDKTILIRQVTALPSCLVYVQSLLVKTCPYSHENMNKISWIYLTFTSVFHKVANQWLINAVKMERKVVLDLFTFQWSEALKCQGEKKMLFPHLEKWRWINLNLCSALKYLNPVKYLNILKQEYLLLKSEESGEKMFSLLDF